MTDVTTVDDADEVAAARVELDGFSQGKPALVFEMIRRTLGWTSDTTSDGREADRLSSQIRIDMACLASRDMRDSIDLADYLASQHPSCRSDAGHFGPGNEWRRPPLRLKRERRDTPATEGALIAATGRLR